MCSQNDLNSIKRVAKKKISPAEKIASVHIDFDKDNVLPELNDGDLGEIGLKQNKPVLLKKSVIDRNRTEHSDLTDEDFQNVIANALYSPSEIFKANREKPYYHFAKVIEVNSKGKPEIGLALLDVDDVKDNFEVVHAQFARPRSYNAIKNKNTCGRTAVSVIELNRQARQILYSSQVHLLWD